MDTPRNNTFIKTIYLGGGCFWCVEAIYRSLRGVSEVVPGYMGGSIPNPSYEQVSTGTTGHAEVVKLVYDESLIATADILDVFFATHDPTTLDRQGADVGSQYRSIIFYTDEAMREAALAAIARAQAALSDRALVVTHVAEEGIFYPAEDYHRAYYERHKDAPYCQVVIDPKIEKLQKQFSDLIEKV